MTTSSEKGFTLIELLIYVGLSAIILTLFGAILVTVTRLGGQQSGSTQLNSELSFLMNAIKQRVRDTVEVDSITDANTRIILRTNTYGSNLTEIYLNSADDRIYLIENGAGATPLSSDKIRITDLEFVSVENNESKSIQIDITAETNTTNPQNLVSRNLRSAQALYIQQQ